MVSNSNNISKTKNHLSPQINEHTKITKYGLGHPGSGLRQTQKCIAGKWLIGSQSLSRSMDLQRHYGKKSITDSLRHLWFVFRIASVMYVFPRYNNKKYIFASNSKGRTILTREYSNIQVSQLSGTVLRGEICTSPYPRNDLLRIMLLRYSRNISSYSIKLHVIKIIPFITTYFSSNLIANFFDCTV
jgi:hypothetical protein